MLIRLSALAVLISTSVTLAQDGGCGGPGYGDAMARIQGWYEEHPIALFNTQLQVNAQHGREAVVPDGLWGTNSAVAVCHWLQTYGAVNGTDPDWMISSPEEVDGFVTWIGSMVRAELNPGKFETPD